MQEKKQKAKIGEELFSAHTADIIAALNLIKEKGDITYLPLLFKILKNSPEEEVENEIIFILNHLKIKEAVPIITDALTDPEYIAIRKKLTTACWQNGLDYKNYIPVFIDLVIQEDWETGFEAFTVIDNMTEFPEKNILDKATEKIDQALKEADEQKKYFLQEILKLIG